MHDPVNSPAHYTSHPSGVEAITITEHCNFCRGNAIKYIMRAGLKGDEIQDLEKAAWYIQREITRIKNERRTNQRSDCRGVWVD
jgi:hypothetical protein